MPPRRKTLTEKQRAEVETLAAVLSVSQIADYLGVCERTMHAMMQRDPKVRAAYKKGRSKAVGRVAQGLLQRAVAGDTASSIFYLKTQGRWRESPLPDRSAAIPKDKRELEGDLADLLARQALEGDRWSQELILRMLRPDLFGDGAADAAARVPERRIRIVDVEVPRVAAAED